MTLTDRERRHRARQLASDDRAGSWARLHARRRQWDFVRGAWRLLAVAGLFVAIGTLVIILVEPDRFVRGLLVGGLWASVAMAISMLVAQATGASSTNMGALAEQWTASELRQLRPAGWDVVNHFSLSRSDIDHVLFRGQTIFAIETKWSGTGWDLSRESRYLSSALEQVRRNARVMSLWHGVRAAGALPIQPVLFLWGGFSQEKPTRPLTINGVIVIYGKAASGSWRSEVQAGSEARDAVTHEQLWLAFDEQISKRDERELRDSPALPSLERLCWAAFGAFVVGSVSLLSSLWVLRLLDSWWQWGIALGLTSVVASFVDRIDRRSRPFVAGWLAGAVASGIYVIVWLLSSVSTR